MVNATKFLAGSFLAVGVVVIGFAYTEVQSMKKSPEEAAAAPSLVERVFSFRLGGEDSARRRSSLAAALPDSVEGCTVEALPEVNLEAFVMQTPLDDAERAAAAKSRLMVTAGGAKFAAKGYACAGQRSAVLIMRLPSTSETGLAGAIAKKKGINFMEMAATMEKMGSEMESESIGTVTGVNFVLHDDSMQAHVEGWSRVPDKLQVAQELLEVGVPLAYEGFVGTQIRVQVMSNAPVAQVPELLSQIDYSMLNDLMETPDADVAAALSQVDIADVETGDEEGEKGLLSSLFGSDAEDDGVDVAEIAAAPAEPRFESSCEMRSGKKVCAVVRVEEPQE